MLLLLLLLRCVRGRPSWHSAEATPAETRLHAILQARRREIWKERRHRSFFYKYCKGPFRPITFVLLGVPNGCLTGFPMLC